MILSSPKPKSSLSTVPMVNNKFLQNWILGNAECSQDLCLCSTGDIEHHSLGQLHCDKKLQPTPSWQIPTYQWQEEQTKMYPQKIYNYIEMAANDRDLDKILDKEFKIKLCPKIPKMTQINSWMNWKKRQMISAVNSKKTQSAA